MTFPVPGLSVRHYFKHFVVGLGFCALFLLVGLKLAQGRPVLTFALEAYAAANTVFYPLAQIVLARSSYFASLGRPASPNNRNDDEGQTIFDMIFTLAMIVVLPYLLFWFIALPVLPWAFASLRSRPG